MERTRTECGREKDARRETREIKRARKKAGARRENWVLGFYGIQILSFARLGIGAL